MSFLKLGPRSFTNESLDLFYQLPFGHFQPNFECKEIKIHQHTEGHMTKMAAMLIYGKSLLKTSFQEPLV